MMTFIIVSSFRSRGDKVFIQMQIMHGSFQSFKIQHFSNLDLMIIFLVKGKISDHDLLPIDQAFKIRPC